jgi:two-component system nitrate/nitrite response regulator NarL
MTRPGAWPDRIPRAVAAAVDAAVAARGDAGRLQWFFQRSHVPMVMIDDRRRYVDVNRPARLVFRLTLDELRTLAVDDLTPLHRLPTLRRLWAELLEAGSVAGQYQVAGVDGSRLETVFCAQARIAPDLHLIAFAPADWPEGELDGTGADDRGPLRALTPREIEVLALTADGLGGPQLAGELWLSLATVNTHFKNIYEKLEVSNRAAAVAKALRLGLIE